MAARPLVARQPNERLQALIQEAGCSNAGLARRVNMCGAEHGLDLRYDKTSVARWLRGQQPRGRAPGIIAEALGRKLGRTVTIDEIGMANGKNLASGVGLQFSPTVLGAIEQVCELWRSDVGRRDFLSGSTVASSALVEPSRDWLISVPDGQVSRQAGPRVGQSDVAAVRAMTQALVDLDHQYGSGHVRPVVVHYLNSVVSGLLAGSYREAVGRELFSAVSRLTELAGYMAVDTGQPGLAQRYYIQALRLAQAAGDRAYGGYVLAASMSHLAAQLGNPREIAQLARAAQEGAKGRATPRAESLFHAAEARGHALLGDASAADGAMGRAADAMEQTGAESADDPVWIGHFDHAYLADELAHCHRDLNRPAQAARYAEQALAEHPVTRVRRRAIGLTLLAAAQVQERDIERACHTGTRAAELLGTLRSSRGTEYLDDLQQRLTPFQDEPVVREFGARLELRAA
ncbi:MULTISPECIES: tetratricopeptide repeat protein [Streptomyces]|uniref:Transcriptional regulator n=3 Tax=Streptomyces TaxID=1883 RepID=A0A8H9HNH5_9ACTN|nr:MULTISPECIES: transcriptional regulator [Streptomyces]MDQ0293937.1 transcriptional regulator with XRE-family HTH domain [Streptomyces sp. DSM 41037]PJM81986.1 transcriptional regulator [Streptomyces sp. TSRI0384-2]RPK89048.1 Protein involved in sporulation [Streptomyces sp. ADI98-12]WPR52548.1 transcriptional regulator [Streptomyces sp. S399]WSU36303.1 transcriptional regulator [Streptomyces gougerotii]